ncbi:hypothetical protein EVAR_55830_1 [Eumeta japonica]|uniref:Uncharacterized protein n=1 Tax=Eumeta variegata TaxID=151549 RepID=A0A4C1YY36_EUMVA|nr:hypothetical protein EVAR_55830_1 [Eumeta japonica]
MSIFSIFKFRSSDFEGGHTSNKEQISPTQKTWYYYLMGRFPYRLQNLKFGNEAYIIRLQPKANRINFKAVSAEHGRRGVQSFASSNTIFLSQRGPSRCIRRLKAWRAGAYRVHAVCTHSGWRAMSANKHLKRILSTDGLGARARRCCSYWKRLA